MGFSSFECHGCGNSIRHPGACRKESLWMIDAVVLRKNGTVIIGHYDGYGRVYDNDGCEHEIYSTPNPCVYHKACWDLLGQPGFTGPSAHAHDQGHFVGNYDPRRPVTKLGLKKLKAYADKERAEIEAEYRKIDAEARQRAAANAGAKKRSGRKVKA